MIIIFFLSLLVSIISFLLAWLPNVSVLPLGIDTAMTTTMGYVNGMVSMVPWLQTPFLMFKWYVGVLIVLVLVRFFIPNRVPHI